MVSETRETVALGMREAEVAQLRIVIGDLREQVNRLMHEKYMLEATLKAVYKSGSKKMRQMIEERGVL